MKKHHRVTIVFDDSYHASLHLHAARNHTWLVASPKNTEAAHEYWKQVTTSGDGLAVGVTTFTRDEDAPDDALDAVLELIEEHHGVFAQASPLTEVLIVGMPATDAVCSVLEDWGYSQVELTPGGLLARRIDDAAENN